jgi:trimethylamine:corrinoid methyltransferase-like protein
LLANTNFVLHSAGWLEGGIASGYEKFVMDADQLGMMQVLAKSVDLKGQALDAIRDVGPGSHFLGCAHTQANFETAFYCSSIADKLRAVGSGRPAGWPDYEAPALDPAQGYFGATPTGGLAPDPRQSLALQASHGTT